MASCPKQIAIVIHSLNGGGSEHAAAMMANYWVEQGRVVSLITLDSVSNDTIHLDPRVKRIGLGLLAESSGLVKAITNNLLRVRKLRAAIRQVAPDVVVSLTDRMNIVTILACRPLRVPLIVAERSDPRHHSIGRIWDRLRRWTYPKANAIVTQTESVKRVVQSFARTAPVYVIANAIRPLATNLSRGKSSSESNDATSELASSQRWIIGVGRLSHEKGFDRLIRAFEKLATLHSMWNLALIGDGAERKELEQQAVLFCHRVRFVGWQEDVSRFLRQSEIFVLPSRYEGFPNTLLEAMGHGLACVAVDCESGPSEIIQHETNGLLAKSGTDECVVDEIRLNLSRLLEDDTLRQRLRQTAGLVQDKFDLQSHFEKWDAIFADSLS